ncbi:MAG: amidohydrolase family protein, partial [Chloroflexota bacterium]
MDFDLLIRQGTIVDGSGMPGYRADVGIRDGLIAEIGHLAAKSAARSIDAGGLVVSPGFIDIHTHLDAQMFWDPYGTCEPQHGMTTVVMGNCGLTLAPVTDSSREDLVASLTRVEAIPRPALEAGVPWGWHTYGDYLDALEGRVGINVGGLVGHVALRHYVMGADSLEREATEAEVERMKELVRGSLRGGALGLSTNRNERHFREDGRPVASRVASEEEILSLGDVLRELNSGIILFSAGPSLAMLDQAARRIERPVVWQNILHYWHRPTEWREKLNAIGATFRDGYRAYAMCDTQPTLRVFNMKNTQRFDEFPTWKTLGFLPEQARKQAMQDESSRAKMRAELDEDRLTTFHRRWDLVDVTKVSKPESQRFLGKSVQDMAAMRSQHPVDAFLDLSLEEDLEAEFETTNSNGDPEAMGEIMRSPHTLIGLSDAGAHVQYQAGYGFSTELLGRWVRERGVL